MRALLRKLVKKLIVRYLAKVGISEFSYSIAKFITVQISHLYQGEKHKGKFQDVIVELSSVCATDPLGRTRLASGVKTH